MDPTCAIANGIQPERQSAVSVTAHGVAYMRGYEQQLYLDPYAQALGGDIGKTWANNEVLRKFGHLTDTNTRDLFAHIIVRTKKIDDLLVDLLETHKDLHQICVLGAGLDTRPWRLFTSSSLARSIEYFELDFGDILDYKHTVLKSLQVEAFPPNISYHPVPADLTCTRWMDQLKASGFDCNKPVVWLVEGVTGYLSEDDNRTLFERLATFSTHGSRLLATFVTPSVKDVVGVTLHQFLPLNPCQLLWEWGRWSGEAIDLQNVAMELQRAAIEESRQFKGYILANMSI